MAVIIARRRPAAALPTHISSQAGINAASGTATVPAGTTTMFVLVHYSSQTAAVATCTMAGNALTFVGRAAGTGAVNFSNEIWRLDSPPIGAGTLVTTYSGSPGGDDITASYWSAAGTTGTVQAESDTGTTHTSTAVTGQVGGYILACTAGTGNPVASGPATQIATDSGGETTAILAANGSAQTISFTTGASVSTEVLSVAINPIATGVTVTSPVATGTGSATAPTPQEVLTVPTATGSGSAAAPTPAWTITAPVAVGSGSAGVPAITIGPVTVTPAVATGSGAAAAPTLTAALTAPTATGTGSATAPTLSGQVVPAVATGSGSAAAPALSETLTAPVAAGSGSAAAPTVTVSGTTVSAPVATGTGSAVAAAVTAPLLTNTLEGGANGTTISNANSGGVSGNAFDYFSGTTGVYRSTSALKGGLSAGITSAVGGALRWFGWQTGIGARTAQTFIRFYVRVPQAVTGLTHICRIEDQATGATIMRLNLFTGGVLRATDSAAATVGTSTDAISYAVPVRIEIAITPGAGSGAAEIRAWVGANADSSGTPDITLGPFTSQQFGANFDRLALGWNTTGAAPQVADQWLYDDIAVATGTWIGPSITGATTITANPAIGLGNAAAPTISESITAPIATGSGSAVAPGATRTIPAPIATGTGAAAAPTLAEVVTGIVATGSGVGIAPTLAAQLAAPTAVGSGAATSPTVGRTVTVSVATGTGAATAPTISESITAPVATGSGSAPGAALVIGPVTVTAPKALGSGTAASPTVTCQVLSPVAAGSGVGATTTLAASLAPPVATGAGTAGGATYVIGPVTVSPPVAAGSGAASTPTVSVLLTAPAATGSGSLTPPSVTGGEAPPKPTGSGSALAPTLIVVLGVPVGAGSGAAVAPTLQVGGGIITPSIAHGTGVSAAPALIIGPVTVTPGAALGSGASTAPLVTILVPSPKPSGSGAAVVPALIRLIGPPVAVGSGVAVAPAIIIAFPAVVTPSVAHGTGTSSPPTLSVLVFAPVAVGYGVAVGLVFYAPTFPLLRTSETLARVVSLRETVTG